MTATDALEAHPTYPVWRYTASDRTYQLSNLNKHASSRHIRVGEVKTFGKLGEEPAWVAKLLHVGSISGHRVEVHHPPPTIILWFMTDHDGNLVDFLEIR